MRLETTARPGLSGPAGRRLFTVSFSGSDRIVLGLWVLVPVAVSSLSGTYWWLSVTVAYLALLGNKLVRGVVLSRRNLGPGARVVATWGVSSVAIERRTGEVVYDYRSLRLHERRSGLCVLRIDLPLRPRPLWLMLPHEVVPPDVVRRLEQPVALPDLQHVAVVPDDFGTHLTRDAWLHARRRGLAPFLFGVILLDAVLLAALGAWYLAVPAAGFVLLVATSWRRVARTSLRSRPAGSRVGTAFSASGLTVDTVHGRQDAPYSRVRSIDAVGPRHAMIVLRRPQGVLVLPRAALPDAAIDHVRRAIGKPPLLARQRATRPPAG